MIFDANRIRDGIDTYNEIMREVNTSVFCTPSFRTLFNGFYRLRQKPEKWYDAYYSLFLRCKANPMSFKEVLTEIYKSTGEIHASFCSKLIATLDPNKPIWDQYVLQWLGFSLSDPKDKEERITYYSNIYDQIEREYNIHLSNRNIQEAIAVFDRLIPAGKGLTSVKKLDFMLWSNRSDRTVSILDYNKLLDDLDDLNNNRI